MLTQMNVIRSNPKTGLRHSSLRLLWAAATLALSCTLSFNLSAAEPGATKAAGAEELAAGEEGLYVVVEATQRPLDGALVMPPACGPHKTWCATVQQVLHNDLKLSGVVRALELPKATVSSIKRYNLPGFEVNLPAAQKAGAVYAIGSWIRRSRKQAGMVELHIGMIDTRRGKSVQLGRRSVLIGSPKRLRKLAHRAANVIFGALTGVEGSFDGRLFYSGPGPGCQRCIWMADADGHNARVIVGGDGIHMLPRPTNGGGLLYVSFRPDLPSLFRLNGAGIERAWQSSPHTVAPFELRRELPKSVKSKRKRRRRQRRRGRRRKSASKRSAQKMPAVDLSNMPRGPKNPWAMGTDLQFRTAATSSAGRVVATINDGEQADLWLLDAKGRPKKNLTNHASDDLDPSWSPDGRQIAFVSNRTGRPQIYVMNADGSGVKRMTFAGPYNTGPDWGPNGKIVYSGLRGSAVDILTVDTNRQMQRLTPGLGKRSLEPSWAPCGRRVVYVSDEDGGGARLWFASHDGAVRHPLALPRGRYYTPVWRKSPGQAPKPFRP